MVTNEPMTDEQLDDIDEMLHDGDELPHDVAVRLANEVDRLRTREQALAAENAAMRPIVEAVAGEMAVYWNRDQHRFCCHRCVARPTLNMNQIEHEPDCRYVKARAFLAAHPATDTAAESEGE